MAERLHSNPNTNPELPSGTQDASVHTEAIRPNADLVDDLLSSKINISSNNKELMDRRNDVYRELFERDISEREVSAALRVIWQIEAAHMREPQNTDRAYGVDALLHFLDHYLSRHQDVSNEQALRKLTSCYNGSLAKQRERYGLDNDVTDDLEYPDPSKEPVQVIQPKPEPIPAPKPDPVPQPQPRPKPEPQPEPESEPEPEPELEESEPAQEPEPDWEGFNHYLARDEQSVMSEHDNQVILDSDLNHLRVSYTAHNGSERPELLFPDSSEFGEHQSPEAQRQLTDFCQRTFARTFVPTTIRGERTGHYREPMWETHPELRQQLAETYCNLLARSLNVTMPLQVKFVDPESVSYYGSYVHTDKEHGGVVEIIRDHPDGTIGYARTLAHEVWHAYQYECAENCQTEVDWAYRKAMYYAYSPSEGDFDEYYNQAVEIEARQFAELITSFVGDLNYYAEDQYRARIMRAA